MEDLANLRDKIRAIDAQLLETIAERITIAKKIGQLKVESDLPIKDYRVEKDVIERNRRLAENLGLYSALAEEISRLMIRYAVLAQDEFTSQVKAEKNKEVKKVVIVGGAGHMGRWLALFFRSFGHGIRIVDPAPSSIAPKIALEEGAAWADIIVLATPISRTAAIIDQLRSLRPSALIFDISSLKSPLIGAIERGAQAGLSITSVHPMFGPDVQMLAGRNILICQTTNPDADNEAATLFQDTTASLIKLPLHEHDQRIGYVLGLSHLINLVFGHVLCESGIDFTALQQVASTTFNAQLEVVKPVVNENQDLYFEIQAENNFTPELIAGLQESLNRFAETIKAGDAKTFRDIMARSRDYLVPAARR